MAEICELTSAASALGAFRVYERSASNEPCKFTSPAKLPTKRLWAMRVWELASLWHLRFYEACELGSIAILRALLVYESCEIMRLANFEGRKSESYSITIRVLQYYDPREISTLGKFGPKSSQSLLVHVPGNLRAFVFMSFTS